MPSVVADLSMSLDGFIALPDDSVGPLFEWYGNGDVEVTMPGDHPAAISRMTRASADWFQTVIDRAGAIVSGRRVFDYTDGWGGAHPVGVPIVVLTHSVPTEWVEKYPDAPFTFVTDGVEAAVEQAKALAGDKDVSVAGPNVIQQCLAAGLLDEIVVDLVPVLLGQGVRFFERFDGDVVTLEDPEVVQGERVTHLHYRVRR